MDLALQKFSDLLEKFDCYATFPITAVALKRHRKLINKYLGQNIEFAVHGYNHVDYSQFDPKSQLEQLQLARDVFERVGIKPKGFRSPYLSRDDNLSKAIETAGYSYVSNQPILWEVLSQDDIPLRAIVAYKKALAFYKPWKSSERLSIPKLCGKLVDIPVSLPDDEILVDRLSGSTNLVKKTWLNIQSQAYHRGELFTLQLHPERIGFCADSLSAVLAEARVLSPAVWFARLDEIAIWWKTRLEATIDISNSEGGQFNCIVNGPSGTTILARGIEINAPSSPWTNGYLEVNKMNFSFKSSIRPIIGVTPSTSKELVFFLRQQGYIVEIAQQPEHYSIFLDQYKFDSNNEISILELIEETNHPLLKFGRWPNGSKSALAITGDIDALTIWDYVYRLFGR
ncbi:MAG: polysaccharide deacetylase family protein [Anaerolineaceae bacterium]|nr:polysaccharide deacetylase family protein [Anaerolineaceae bacterium]